MKPVILVGLLALGGIAFAAVEVNGSIAGITLRCPEWTDDAEGVFKQIKVVSALLSKFRIQACNEAGVIITLDPARSFIWLSRYTKFRRTRSARWQVHDRGRKSRVQRCDQGLGWLVS